MLTTHIVVDGATSPEEALQTKRTIKALLDQFNVQHVTVEIECEGEHCEMSNNKAETSVGHNH